MNGEVNHSFTWFNSILVSNLYWMISDLTTWDVMRWDCFEPVDGLGWKGVAYVQMPEWSSSCF